MYIQKKRTANLVYKDRSLMLLSDVLYVPDLEVNLLSARHICQAKLKTRFNNVYIYFKFSRKKVIETTINKELYIVTHVVKRFKKTVFISTDINMQDTTENILILIKLKEEQSELTEDQKKIYMLIY
jgi:hypothetical protein